MRLHNLYNDYCDDCHTPIIAGKHIHLAANDKPDSNLFKRLFKAVETAYKYLYNAKSYSADDIKKYNDLIEATNDVFSSALKKGIKDNVIPSRMRTALEEDVFVFSALKTHAQLFEASRLLTDAEGKIKSFEKFSRDIEKIQKDYNQNYLEAEYQFAVSSAQQAANWAEIEKNGDRYNLQYRTANDDRVRKSHEELEGITLPPSDKFWDNYYPPNGWRCRCVAVEVLKDKYTTSDSKDSIKKGEKATSHKGKDGKNRLEIFRFNPGKEKVIFPEHHPYKPKGCNGSLSSLKGVPEFYLKADDGKCRVKHLAKIMYTDSKFTTKKIGKGTLAIHKDLDPSKSDYKSVNEIGEHFARQGENVVLPPKFDATLKSEEYKQIYKELENTPFWGKCPDVYVGGIFYEHEGFTTAPPKKAFRNMMNRGLKQSTRVIIDACGLTDSYMIRNIGNRIFLEGQNIDEVWVKEGKTPRLLYKNAKTP